MVWPCLLVRSLRSLAPDSISPVAGLSVRDALRQKGTPYDELALGDAALSDDALLDAMLAHPILINRPFVQTDNGTRLCRPSELVLDILPKLPGPFRKEDGELVAEHRGSPAT